MDVVLLSAPIIDQIIADSRFSEFPCFANPPTMLINPASPQAFAQGCNSCGGRKAAIAAQRAAAANPNAPPVKRVDYNQIKLAVHNMPAELKQKFREILGCDIVVLQYKDQNGNLDKDEF